MTEEKPMRKFYVCNLGKVNEPIKLQLVCLARTPLLAAVFAYQWCRANGRLRQTGPAFTVSEQGFRDEFHADWLFTKREVREVAL